jgi:hypothetical protein
VRICNSFANFAAPMMRHFLQSTCDLLTEPLFAITFLEARM